jgi:hypothetical protein
MMWKYLQLGGYRMLLVLKTPSTDIDEASNRPWSRPILIQKLTWSGDTLSCWAGIGSLANTSGGAVLQRSSLALEALRLDRVE